MSAVQQYLSTEDVLFEAISEVMHLLGDEIKGVVDIDLSVKIAHARLIVQLWDLWEVNDR